MITKWFRVMIGALLLSLLALPIGMVFAGGDNNVNWNELGHDSRDELYRSPGGAVPTGTSIRLRLRALDGDLSLAQVRVWNDRINVSTLYDMTLVASGVTLPSDPTLYEFWEVTLPPSTEPTIYYYRFIAIDGTATAYYEDDNRRTGGWGQTYSSSPDNSWQLTHYDPAFTTPDWVQNAVIYQIFPDRFRDGDATNNPAAGEFFYGDTPADVTIVRSNDTEWNTVICDPRATVGAAAACENKYSQNFYGGDLQGIIDKLAYLDSLGVTALYLNPIFASPSNHRYDTYDFMQIDSSLGDLALFQELATEADALGIRLILDGVFNHTSSDSIYFDRYGRYSVVGACESTTSIYRSWFYFVGTGVCDGANYESWFGYDSLPKINADTPAVRDYFINNGTASVGPYWMQWADGWRLDVGGDVDSGQINDPNDDYWDDFRTAVRAINPDTYIVGEEWGNATSWTVGGEWDATMNYQFAAAVMSLWRDELFTDNDFNSGSSAGTLDPLTPGQFNERILNLQERYAPEAYAAMMNLIGSHDNNRALFRLDHNAESNNTALYADPNYDWSDAIRRLRGVTLVQLTMPGAPTIYYGDEIAVVNPPSFSGGKWEDDPYNRAPFPWLDETGTPYYTHMQNATFQDEMTDYVAALANARNAHPALRTGEYIPLNIETDRFTYLRIMPDDSDAALVVINRGASTQDVTAEVNSYLPVGATFTDVLTNAVYMVDGARTITVPAMPSNTGTLLVLTSTITRPATVSDLTATPGGNQVALEWSDAANADGYIVFRSRLSGGGYINIGTPSTSNFTDTTVMNSVQYHYVVQAINNTTYLRSDMSNEVAAVPAYDLTTAWYNLEWPHTLNWVQSAVNETDAIYGQIYIPGVTDASATPVAGIRAQVGFGPQSDPPMGSTWTWYEMEPNPGFNFGQNNDEYQGTMLPSGADAGTYYYTTRYSSDNGATWYYTDKNGPPYAGADAGVLTITEPTDNIPPAAPTNLEVTATTAVSISLAWDAHPDTDGDLFGFEVWRQFEGFGLTARGETVTNEALFDKIATISNPDATSYTDSTAQTNGTYSYYLTAIDTSTNRSDPSNTVMGTAVMQVVDVTLVVTVPAGTPGTVYVAGGFPPPYPEWNPGGIMLSQLNATTWTVTLQLLDGAVIPHKFTRGDWDRVEKGVNNNEINDRQLTVVHGGTGVQTVNVTVANWRDPYVIDMSPMNGQMGVSANTTITAQWSQPMNATQVNEGGWTVTGPGGTVAGTLAYDNTTRTSTFTPNAPLADGTYTVLVTGRVANNGDGQRVPAGWAFVVGAPSNIINNGSFTNPVGNDPNGQWAVYAVPDGSMIYGQMGGVFEFYRLPISTQGVVFQHTGVAAPAETAMNLTIDIGNISLIRQRVAIVLHDSDWDDLQFCTFWLEAGQALETYQIRTFNSQAWTNATISVYASTMSENGFIQLDNARLTPIAGGSYTETLCIDPNAPGATAAPTGVNMLVNGGFNESFAPNPDNGWVAFNMINAQVTNGFLQVYRTGSPAGSVFQHTGDAIPVNTPLEVSFRVSNGGTLRQRVTVIAHAADWSNLGACTFWIDGMTPLTTIVMRTYNPVAWANAAISFYPQPEQIVPSSQFLAIDDVVYRQIPDKTIVGTECYGVGSTLPAQIEGELLALQANTAPAVVAPAVVAPAAPAAVVPAGMSAEQPLAAPSAPTSEVTTGEGTVSE